ncbi:MAG: Uma2 family endonuclease [Oculatellaceae cyanobacterium bins.114]|nr:Uma2 family endonuclease [Oculatellaceae cyanobacterium bins.114]
MTAVTPKRFTLNDYHRLIDLKFFAEGDRIELIRGELIQMAAKGTPHSVCNTRLLYELLPLLRDCALVRNQGPVILPLDSEPEPDFAIVRFRDDLYLSTHPYPDDIVLIIEVSDSSLDYDQTTKLSLYAENQIQHYWIVNLVDRCLEQYSEPYQKATGEFGYRSKHISLRHEQVELPNFSGILLDLSKIFWS